ncbi:MAG: carbohydrate porin, partial [Spirulina sp.]
SRLSTDAVGATLNWAIIPEVEFLSWFGYTDSSLVSHSGNVQTVNWMFGLNFPDLGGEDNYGAVFFGQPPRITGSNLRNNGVLSGNIPSVFAGTFGVTTEGRSDRTFHSEALYYWRISDNIAITPGVIVIFNPSHNTDSDTIAIGAIRTTLTF